MGLFKKKKKEENKNEQINNTQPTAQPQVQNQVQQVPNQMQPGVPIQQAQVPNQVQNPVSNQMPNVGQNMQPINQNINAQPMNQAPMNQPIPNAPMPEQNTQPQMQSQEQQAVPQVQPNVVVPPNQPTAEANNAGPNSPEEIETLSTDGVEMLDLENEEKPPVKKGDTKEEKKENRALIIIMLSILAFCLLLPTVTKWFKKSSIFSYTDDVEEIINDKTEDGYLVIGKEEGSITARKVQFYNFYKRSDNQISMVYLPSTGIKDINKQNIYIELYDANKNIIYREKFLPTSKVERKVQGRFNITVTSDVYKQSYYSKIVIIDADEWGKPTSTLTCSFNTIESGYTYNEKITYNFSKLGLLSYKVSKKVTKSSLNQPSEDLENSEENPNEDIETDITETEGDDIIASANPFTKVIEEEAELIEDTNITDLKYDEATIEYTVPLATLDASRSGYTPVHSHGSILRTIRLEEESKGWSCE